MSPQTISAEAQAQFKVEYAEARLSLLQAQVTIATLTARVAELEAKYEPKAPADRSGK